MYALKCDIHDGSGVASVTTTKLRTFPPCVRLLGLEIKEGLSPSLVHARCR